MAAKGGRSPMKSLGAAAVREAMPTTSVLAVDHGSDPGHLPAVVSALIDAGFSVDTIVPSSRDADGGRLPAEAFRYDVVILRPAVPAQPRSTRMDPLETVEFPRLKVDAQRRMVYVDGQPVRMSAREFTLLHYLANKPGVVFSREALLHAVWGSNWRTEGSVTEYIRRLRMILQPTGIADCIVTRKGFGYAFDPDVVS